MQHSNRANMALEYSNAGFNCAQSTFLAFEDMLNMDFETMAKISSSFGGGLGMGDVCGVVSAMAMVMGLLYGFELPDSPKTKQAHYDTMKTLIHKFKAETGSHICSELLGIDGKCLFTPTKRSEEYWNGRPCKYLIVRAVEMLEEYINSNGLN